MDEGSTLIDNSKARDSGFSSLGSVPANPFIITPQIAALTAALSHADPGLPAMTHDEGETEDEEDEDMDEVDEVDDAFDADALDNEEEAQLAASASELSANETNSQAHTADPFPPPTDGEYVLVNGVFVNAALFSSMPDLVSLSSSSETDQQTLEGNA